MTSISRKSWQTENIMHMSFFPGLCRIFLFAREVMNQDVAKTVGTTIRITYLKDGKKVGTSYGIYFASLHSDF